MTSRRRVQPLAFVAGGLFGFLVIGALVSEAVFHTSIDPTEQTFTVTLHNDTAGTVVVKQCGAECDSFHETDRLRPGASVSVNTSSDGAANWWAVTDANGRTLGCIPLTFHHKDRRACRGYFQRHRLSQLRPPRRCLDRQRGR